MLQILAETEDNMVATKATGKLTKMDYDKLLPLLFNKLNMFHKICWYFEMENFKGWDLDAFWEDEKFDVKHANDFEKIAMVGDREWQEWMTGVMKPFTAAEIKCFELTEKENALNWIKSDM